MIFSTTLFWAACQNKPTPGGFFSLLSATNKKQPHIKASSAISHPWQWLGPGFFYLHHRSHSPTSPKRDSPPGGPPPLSSGYHGTCPRLLGHLRAVKVVAGHTFGPAGGGPSLHLDLGQNPCPGAFAGGDPQFSPSAEILNWARKDNSHVLH